MLVIFLSLIMAGKKKGERVNAYFPQRDATHGRREEIFSLSPSCIRCQYESIACLKKKYESILAYAWPQLFKKWIALSTGLSDPSSGQALTKPIVLSTGSMVIYQWIVLFTFWTTGACHMKIPNTTLTCAHYKKSLMQLAHQNTFLLLFYLHYSSML